MINRYSKSMVFFFGNRNHKLSNFNKIFFFKSDMAEIVKCLGRPDQIRFEVNFYGCQQEAIQTRVTEWQQNSDISGNS